MANTTPSTDSPVVAFIGGGNMARSLIGGMIARGADPATIRVAEPVDALRESLQADFDVRCFATAAEAVEGAAIWLLAVKPQVMRAVCEPLAALAQAQRPLLVSIAAGIPVARLQAWLDRMPKAAAAVSLVDRAAKWVAAPASPSAAASQPRTSAALVIVSCVVKVLEATSTRVRAGSSPARIASHWCASALAR